ncbi:MAG: hypothetical protein WCQ99_03645 [Pseudomonadota bacterium]
MTAISETLKKKLLTIIKDDYEECGFFMASSNMLTHKIKEVSDSILAEPMEFNQLRDSIGEIGIFISNTEKRLEEVEECYTKMVEILAEEKPHS